MTTRVRNQTYSVASGSAKRVGDGLGDWTSSYTITSECGDVIGNMDGENPFYLEKTNNACWFLQGRSRSGTPYWNYNGYCKSNPPGGHLPPSADIPSNNSALSEGLAKTNPNTPVVDVPVFLAELRDIPRTLRFVSDLAKGKYGSRLIKATGNAYLTHEFGTKLMLKDLARMMDFTNHTERKLRNLRNLQTGKTGLHRSAKTWSNTVTFAPWVTYASPIYQEGNRVSATWVTERQQWVSTKWKPLIDITSYSDDKLRSLANRLVFGLDITFATLWEAMPWSWLIDWFSNVGDLVSQTRNVIPVSHNGSCVMFSTISRPKTIEHYSGPGFGLYKAKPADFTRKTLMRTPMAGPPLPEFSLPFLDGRQLSILSAIAVTRL